MDIKLNRHSESPIYMQIKGAIKNKIISKELVPSYKLPSERTLASELHVHRNTVIKAYTELIAEGFVVASRVSPRGYFVQETNETSGKNVFFPLSKTMKDVFSENEKLFESIFTESSSKDFISFGGIIIGSYLGLIARMDFIFQKMKNDEWIQNIVAFENNETNRLKHNICDMLKLRNIYINNKNVQIVSESTMAISYVIDLYLEKGDYIIAEEPIIPDTINVFRNHGIKVETVSMNEDGMNLVLLKELIKKRKPKFIYTMPNHHNPTTIIMPLKKRLQLLEIAKEYGIPILEEDSLRDFNYEDNNIPCLYALDTCDSVIYIDTFTLTFLPGVKTAYILGPYEPISMVGKLLAVDQMDLGSIGQFMLNEFIEAGEFEKYIVDLQQYYKAKRDLLCAELKKIENKGISFITPKGSLFVWCTLTEHISERKLYQIAKELGILIVPGFVFYQYGYQGEEHIRLCFSNVSDEQIVKGVEILGRAIDLSKQ